MPKVKLTIWGWRCERCGHEWIPREQGAAEPKVCPKCKSPYWNTPRKVKPSKGGPATA
jgi:predicted Zn-ribbon and HTH transcriptional regulator